MKFVSLVNRKSTHEVQQYDLILYSCSLEELVQEAEEVEERRSPLMYQPP
jgi:hypothetical protein